MVTNGEPRPVGELIGQIAMAGGAQAPNRRVSPRLARGVGAVIEKAWELPLGLGRLTGDGEPPLTQFLAEQLSTAHWFDQRRTREVLGWEPTVSLDEGLRRLAEYYAAR